MTKEVFDSTIYKNNSIEELICEFEAHSADKVPFMTCNIDSHLSEFSNIEGSKYAATPTRIDTIELIAKERRIPSYMKKDKSIFLEEKEVAKIFQEELDKTQKEEQRLEKQNEWINKRIKKESIIEKRNIDKYYYAQNISKEKENRFTYLFIGLSIFALISGDFVIHSLTGLRNYILICSVLYLVFYFIFKGIGLFNKD